MGIGGANDRSSKPIGRAVRRQQRRGERRQRHQRDERHAGAPHDSRLHPPAQAGIDDRQQHVGQQRAGGEECAARRGAAGDQVHVARPQRIEHEAPEAGPRRHDLDDERSAQQAAEDEPVDRHHAAAARASAHAARRSRPRGTPRAAAAVTNSSPIVSAVACDCRRSIVAARRHGNREDRHDEMPGEIGQRGKPAAAGRVGRTHAAGRQPAGPRRQDDQQRAN